MMAQSATREVKKDKTFNGVEKVPEKKAQNPPPAKKNEQNQNLIMSIDPRET